MTQLVLEIGLADNAVFDNFVVGDNAAVVDTLCRHASEPVAPVVWLSGPPGSGRSHLLQAACAHAAGFDRDIAYVPLAEPGTLAPGVLEGLENRALVCLDDVDRIAGQGDWEAAVFALFNGLEESGGALLVAAQSGPRRVPFSLPDLRSRLSSGPMFALKPLDDEACIDALKLRAGARGLAVPDDVAGFLIRRYRRDMATLFELLERLDRASLEAKRRLTVPFVRSVLD